MSSRGVVNFYSADAVTHDRSLYNANVVVVIDVGRRYVGSIGNRVVRPVA
jgi:hypothetical protein